MTNNTRKFMVFAIALAMASPAALGFGESEAFAAPGDLIKSSNDGGRRTHKQARKRTTKKSDKKKKTTSRTTTRTTTRGTTTRRVPGTTTRRTISRDEARRRGATTTTTRTRTRTPERTTTRTRTRYGRDGGTTTNRTTTRTNRGRTTTTTTTRRRSDDRYDRGRTTTTRTRDRYDRGRTTTVTRTRDADRYDRGRTTTTTTTRRTRVYRDTPATTVRVERTYREPVRRTTVVTRPASRTTVVNHHHHHGPSSGASTGTVQRAPAAAPVQQDSLVDGYITASVGATGMAIPVVSDQPLPGIDYQLGVGGKSGWLAAELGFNLAGYRLDPNAAESDLTMVGLTADVKLQPSFGFVEPYVVAGVGGHVLTDHYVDSSSSGASLRLGGGVDFRIENVALSAQYLRTGYGLANDGGYTASNGEVNATTETVGLGLKFYF
jgi:hypothetical protein